MPVISVFGRLRQEDCREFKVRLSYLYILDQRWLQRDHLPRAIRGELGESGSILGHTASLEDELGGRVAGGECLPFLGRV